MIADRRPYRTSVLAFALAAVALVEAAAIVALVIASRSLNFAATAIPISIVAVSCGLVGAVVSSRRPANLTGWVFLFSAVVVGLAGLSDQYAAFALVTHPGSLPGAVWAMWLNSWLQVLVFPGAVTLLVLVFPDGHLPSRRWKPVAATAVILTVILALPGGAFFPGPLQTSIANSSLANPVGLPSTGPVGAVADALGVLWPVALLTFLVAASAPLLRMRRARADERQQLKLIAYAIVVSAFAIGILSVAQLVDTSLPSWPAALALAFGFGVAVPVAAAVAIFKHRLYDIDIVISRTLVYGALALFITAVYVGIAVGIGALVGGGGKPNLGLSILATAIVAVGFQPVRERVQRVANRLVYGKRASPYEVLSQFSARVAESYAADDVLPRMARVLAEGTGAQRADVWLRSGAVWRDAAVWPAGAAPSEPAPMSSGTLPSPNGANRLVEVRHQGQLLGALSVTKRLGESLDTGRGEPAHPPRRTGGAGAQERGAEQRPPGPAAGAARVAAEVGHGPGPGTPPSRTQPPRRCSTAPRGAQGEARSRRDAGESRSREGQGDDRTAQERRGRRAGDIAGPGAGIYPPLLAEKGLGAALESQVRKATIPVTVDTDGIARYSQDVEAAVYFSVLEALQNVQKYAQASQATVRLREEDGTLRFEVADDGKGFDVATTARGSGLTNMMDRLDALGGHLEVRSTTAGGTRLLGRLHVAGARQGEPLEPAGVR